MTSIQALESLRVAEADLATETLSLEADTGESIMILARGVGGSTADTIIQESIDEETMLAYPADNNTAELFLENTVQRLHTDVHAKLRDAGLSAPMLMVPEGDEYRLTTNADMGTATVLYKELGPTGVSDGQPGTPGSKTRTFITSAKETVSVDGNGTETATVETSQNPGILRDFPYAEDVPAQREYDLQALAVTLNSSQSGGGTELEGFRLQSEERDFIARGSAFVDPELAQYPNRALTRLPLVFPAEPTFGPGDELDLEVKVSNSDGSSQDAVVNASMIFYRRGVGV
jgi:hypothetical protein